MNRIKALLGRRVGVVLTVALVAGMAVASMAWARCDQVVAGCDDCTICQRWYMIGDDLCYENYYYCIDTCSGNIDGYYNNRCEPF
jgi:hypothetical protein